MSVWSKTPEIETRRPLWATGAPSCRPDPAAGDGGSTPGRRLRCVIVEDEVMFEQLLTALLEAEGILEVVASAHTVRDGIAACRNHLPDLLLLDLALPDGHGMEVADALASLRPDARTIIVSGEADTFRCPPGSKPFIHSVVDKTRAFAVLRGEIADLRAKWAGADECGGGTDALSPRELEIFRLIGRGMSNKEIASAAFISCQTVETHRKNIAAKLGISARELMRRACLHDLTAGIAG